MTEHADRVGQALDDFDCCTGYSLDEAIQALIAENKDLEEQVEEAYECAEGMKAGFTERITEAEAWAAKLEAFANRWLGFTVLGVRAHYPGGLEQLVIDQARNLGLTIPANLEVSDAP